MSPIAELSSMARVGSIIMGILLYGYAQYLLLGELVPIAQSGIQQPAPITNVYLCPPSGDGLNTQKKENLSHPLSISDQ